jgi:hypothetical protein
MRKALFNSPNAFKVLIKIVSRDIRVTEAMVKKLLTWCTQFSNHNEHKSIDFIKINKLYLHK